MKRFALISHPANRTAAMDTMVGLGTRQMEVGAAVYTTLLFLEKVLVKSHSLAPGYILF